MSDLPPGGPPVDGDGLVADLTRYLAEQRADAAAASRARAHWLRQAAAEEAMVAGVLLDLGERAATVVVQGVAGRTHRGLVRAVGEDFVALRTRAGDTLLPYDAIVTVRGDDGGPAATGDRAPALDIGFAEAIAATGADRPRVLVVARDGTGLSGRLRSVGRDVVTLRLADGAGDVHVPMASLAELTVVEA